jgi:hypothetical protein
VISMNVISSIIDAKDLDVETFMVYVKYVVEN